MSQVSDRLRLPGRDQTHERERPMQGAKPGVLIVERIVQVAQNGRSRFQLADAQHDSSGAARAPMENCRVSIRRAVLERISSPPASWNSQLLVSQRRRCRE